MSLSFEICPRENSLLQVEGTRDWGLLANFLEICLHKMRCLVWEYNDPRLTNSAGSEEICILGSENMRCLDCFEPIFFFDTVDGGVTCFFFFFEKR